MSVRLGGRLLAVVERERNRNRRRAARLRDCECKPGMSLSQPCEDMVSQQRYVGGLGKFVMVIMTYGVEGSHRNGAGESTGGSGLPWMTARGPRLSALLLGRDPALARQGLIPLTARPLSSGAEAGEWGWLISSGQPTARTLIAPERKQTKQTPCQRA